MATEWQVRLEGNAADLARLASVTSPRFEVRKRPDGYVLLSSSFSGTSADVKEAADRLLGALGAVLKLHDESADLPTTGSVLQVSDGGAKSTTVFPPLARLVLRAYAPDVLINGIRQPDTAFEADIDAAITHPDARRAADFLSAGTWVELYKAYEVLREAVGGDEGLKSRGWASSALISRFRHTANYMERHAAGIAAPASPLSLSEGRQLMRTLLRAWFNEINPR